VAGERDRRKEEVMSHTGNGLKTLALLAGVGAAAFAAGLLTAPASGRETRRRIGRRLREERAALLRKGRRAVEEAGEFAAGRIEEGKEKVRSVIG
jgi:gas vesicle protein